MGGKYKENTILAFLAARNAGCDMIEFDVRRTKDDHLIVSHNAELNSHVTICEHTLSELIKQKLVFDESRDLLSEDNNANLHKAPTLQEVLRRFAMRTRLNIELKDLDSTESLIQSLNEYARASHKTKFFSYIPGIRQRIVVSSFRESELHELGEYRHSLERCFLWDSGILSGIKQALISRILCKGRIDGIHLSSSSATPNTVAYFLDKRFAVRLFTINHPEPFYNPELSSREHRGKGYGKTGLTGVFTDNLEEFLYSRQIHSGISPLFYKE